MRFCYIDESGCTGQLPTATSNIQPVLAVGGLFIDAKHIVGITREFVKLKKKFFPRVCRPSHRPLDWILCEVKGAELRAAAASDARNKRRHARGFLDELLDLIESYGCVTVGRVWVKGVGATIKSGSIYTSSIQYIHSWFNRYLHARDDTGIVIGDSRLPTLNSQVSFSVFTAKFQRAGDRYPRILELPTFAHSENHAGVQIADLLYSAIVFPLAIDAYCAGQIQSVHVRPRYADLRTRYGRRLAALQFRGQEPLTIPPRWGGGIIVCDTLGCRPSSRLFGVPAHMQAQGDHEQVVAKETPAAQAI